MSDCVFCQIVRGAAPARIEAHWPDALAFVPLNPVTDGHLLVVPRVHVTSYLEDPIVTGVVMARAAELAARLGRGLGQSNLITSAGDDATQTVFHMHVHLIPREAGDAISLPWDVRYA